MAHETTIDLASPRVDGANEVVFVEDAPLIWEQLVLLGESAPAGTWDHVPTDLSTRIDELIYRRKQDPA